MAVTGGALEGRADFNKLKLTATRTDRQKFGAGKTAFIPIERGLTVRLNTEPAIIP